jgi:DNA-binding transcriptional MerR regulator
MFTVGEFAQVAQVSRRLLRYYDQIGLLTPIHTDRLTGYRYYSAEQLPDLNRILALKDLGLSLEQIQRLLREPVSPDEMQGMLLLKKAELERQLQADQQRIRNIEARLQSVRDAEAHRSLDVVVKHVPAQMAVTTRAQVPSFDDALRLIGLVGQALADNNAYGHFFGTWHSGGINDPDSDVELGRFVTAKTPPPVPRDDGLTFAVREFPEVPTMATFVVRGPVENVHVGYGAIGVWAEVNGYRFAGSPREIALQLPGQADFSDGVTEVQFPVEAIA